MRIKANEKNNVIYKDYNCDLCKEKGNIIEETQKNILNCPELKTDTKPPPHYEEIFGNNIKNQEMVAKSMKKKFKLREKKIL